MAHTRDRLGNNYAGGTTTYCSGYTGILVNGTTSTNFTGKAWLTDKYYNTYIVESILESTIAENQISHATSETSGWYEDIRDPGSWIIRGSYYEHNKNKGIFSHGGYGAGVNATISFKIVLSVL